MSFTQAYAHTVCCPSRAALLTGRHPNRGGVQSWLQGDRNGSDTHLGNMDPSEITLAEVLREAGYRTALFGKWHLGARVGHGPLDQGFEKHFGHLSGFIDNFITISSWAGITISTTTTKNLRRGEYFPEMIVDEAVKYVDRHSDEPFFMMVAFNLPHYPEQPSEEFKEAFADLEMPRQSYARVMATVDKQVGRVLKQLDDSGIRDDTIIIFSSDNGHSEENNRGITVGYHNSGYPIGHYYLAHGGGVTRGNGLAVKALSRRRRACPHDYQLPEKTAPRHCPSPNHHHNGLDADADRTHRPTPTGKPIRRIQHTADNQGANATSNQGTSLYRRTR